MYCVQPPQFLYRCFPASSKGVLWSHFSWLKPPAEEAGYGHQSVSGEVCLLELYSLNLAKKYFPLSVHGLSRVLHFPNGKQWAPAARCAREESSLQSLREIDSCVSELTPVNLMETMKATERIERQIEISLSVSLPARKAACPRCSRGKGGGQELSASKSFLKDISRCSWLLIGSSKWKMVFWFLLKTKRFPLFWLYLGPSFPPLKKYSWSRNEVKEWGV